MQSQNGFDCGKSHFAQPLPVPRVLYDGKLAEDALIEALMQRRAAGGSETTLDTKIMSLVDRHIDRLGEDGRSIRTIDTYRYCAKLLLTAHLRINADTESGDDTVLQPSEDTGGSTQDLNLRHRLCNGL